MLEEDLNLRRETAQCRINKEMREIARTEKEDDRWEREAMYFEIKMTFASLRKRTMSEKYKLRKRKPLQG